MSGFNQSAGRTESSREPGFLQKRDSALQVTPLLFQAAIFDTSSIHAR